MAQAHVRTSFSRKSTFAFALLLSLLLFFPLLLSAQTGTGRVIGTITDESGASISGAKVTVTNTLTNIKSETKSDSDGSYQVLDLPIGKYSVTAEHEGFATAVTPSQELQINQSLRIDVRLKVGSVAEVVTVQEVASQVETISPTVGGTVTGAPIQNLPLNGRDTLDLALTQPGVLPSSGSPFSGNGVPTGKFTIAGGHDNSVTYTLDGGSNTSVTYGLPVADPNPDTIAEFRILTNNYTAEYGRSAGGVVIQVMKSGTNQLHGTAYDYLRNDAFNANTFFNKSNPDDVQPRPVLKRNQFGGTIGGPITIPHVYDGRDHLFFFFGYQGQRQNSTLVGPLFSTFTPAELNGDFSNSPYASSVASFLQSYPYFQSNPALAAEGIIDPTKIDPVAKAYIAEGLIPTTPNGTIVPNGPASNNSDEYDTKIDWNLSSKDRLTYTMTISHNPVLYPFLATTSFGSAPNVNGFPGLNRTDEYFGNIGYTRTVSQTMLNEFHFTAQRGQYRLNVPQRDLPGPQDLGINITPDEVTGPTQMLFAGSGLQIGFNVNGPARFADNTYGYADTFSWMHGHHTWKFGASLNIVQNNAYFDFAVDGQYGFYGTATGSDLADFLVGVPGYFEQFPKGFSAIRSHQYAAFAQDEWKLNRRLTLTLGLRYEYTTPKSDPSGRQYMIIPGLQSTRYPGAPLGLVFPGDKGAPDGISFPDRNDWAPRVGFAWDPFGDGKTSVRGGFGLFYDVALGQDNQYQNGTVPLFSAAYLYCCTPGGNPAPGSNGFGFLSDPYGSYGVINPFPSSALPPPSQLNFYNQGFLPIGLASVFVDAHMRTPYIYQYNLSVQRQLGKSFLSEFSYVGSSSHKEIGQEDFDPVILGDPNATRILNVQQGIQNFPIPPYSADIGTSNVLNGNYNGFITSLTKQAQDFHGLGNTFFTAAYTFSHLIDDSTGMFRNSSQVPYYDHHEFRSSGDNDIRHRFVFSGGWEMPWAKLWESGPTWVTKGWNLYSIVVAQSGLPMDVTGGLYVDGYAGPSGAGDQNLVKPDWAGGPVHYLDPHQPGNYIFDPSQIVLPACYYETIATPTGSVTIQNPNVPGTPGGCATRSYGTLPRNFFRGPGRLNFDMKLEKVTSLMEGKLQVTLAGEFFNIFNHTQFQNPTGGPTPIYSPQLGQAISTFDPRIGQVSLRLSF
jgi:Carboxypeptidase regulatory-like domain/TonB dependent receptor